MKPPALLRFTSTAMDSLGSSERAIPWGTSNCDATCFANEPTDIASSAMVCYPLELAKGDNRKVEESWSVAGSDTADETWYSTAFLREQTRTFSGITDDTTGASVDCTTYTSPEFPSAMCKLAFTKQWRHGQRCISCADTDANAEITKLLPFWQPLPIEECRMCDHVAGTPSTPTKTPTAAPAPISASSWSSPSGTVTVTWEAAASGGGFTFTLVCVGCASGSTGWVALGINSANTMKDTNAVRWRLTENIVDETVNNGKDPLLVVAASVVGNLRDVSTNLGTKTVTFTTSAFGAYAIATDGADQQFVWAYKDSGVSIPSRLVHSHAASFH